MQEIIRVLREMFPNAGCELKFGSPFELLVAVILSAQCTDKRVNQVTAQLFKQYNTPAQFAQMRQEQLEKAIFSCGFYRNKAANIIAAARQIMSQHGGHVPKTLEELQKLPGVGRKTASVIVAVGFGGNAMPVDTHVFRVSRRLGLSNGKTPLAVEKDLTALLQGQDCLQGQGCAEMGQGSCLQGRASCAGQVNCAEMGRGSCAEIHHRLIFLGRYVCKSRKPDCGGCKLNSVCPSARCKIKGETVCI